jgi:hypothetical protein
MASTSSVSHPEQGNSHSTQDHIRSQSAVAMTKDEEAIAAVVQKLVPIFKNHASATPMQTDQTGENTSKFGFFLNLNAIIDA